MLQKNKEACRELSNEEALKTTLKSKIVNSS